jgi:hypothetical protein
MQQHTTTPVVKRLQPRFTITSNPSLLPPTIPFPLIPSSFTTRARHRETPLPIASSVLAQRENSGTSKTLNNVSFPLASLLVSRQSLTTIRFDPNF